MRVRLRIALVFPLIVLIFAAGPDAQGEIIFESGTLGRRGFHRDLWKRQTSLPLFLPEFVFNWIAPSPCEQPILQLRNPSVLSIAEGASADDTGNCRFTYGQLPRVYLLPKTTS